MAKATNSDFRFRFQLKYGDSYFTNLPRILREESSVSLAKLRCALDKGQRKTFFDVSRLYDDVNNYMNEVNESSSDDDDNNDQIYEVKYSNNYFFLNTSINHQPILP